MNLRCRLGLHAFDHARENVQLRGRLKVTTVRCARCEVARGWVEKL